MQGYTKLFSSILMSSIWEEPTETRIVWVTLLALADQHGHVDGTPKSLARVARVSLKDCQRALTAFLNPDPEDRSGVDNGRRIRPEQGGWLIINHAAYRHRMSAEERRERDKLRKRKARMSAGCPQTSENVLDVSQAEADQIRSEAQEQERARVVRAPERRKDPEHPDPFVDASVTERAARFIERYQELYQTHRKARYLVRDHRDYAAAVPLCATWTDDERLDKLAAIFLTTDNEFAEKGSRTIPQFASMASWADGKLAEWEAKQRPA